MHENGDNMMFKEITRTLGSLQKLKAPSDFEANLMRKINSLSEERTLTFIERFLSPSRLIPSTALAAAAVIILFMFNLQTEDSENPLMTDPRVREDFILADEVALKTESGLAAQRNGSDSSNLLSGDLTRVRNEDLFINKTGLNFRQIYLTEGEKEQLYKLKQKIKSLWNGPAVK